jgi:ferric iron reductase protein FhuF
VSTPSGLTPAANDEPADRLTPAGHDEIVQALDRAGRGNPLLGIATDPAGDDNPTPKALVDAVQAWLGTDERRVAASLVVLGYAARLVGPGLALLLRDGLLPDLRPDRVRYSYRSDRGFRLSLPRPAGWRGPATALRQRWCADVIDAHLAPLVEAVHREGPVATGLLWGNVASGLAGALRTLAGSGAVPPEACLTTGQALLDHGPLRRGGGLTLHSGQLRFVRRSCCLFYRLDGGGTCGDCPLPATIARRVR